MCDAPERKGPRQFASYNETPYFPDSQLQKVCLMLRGTRRVLVIVPYS